MAGDRGRMRSEAQTPIFMKEKEMPHMNKVSQKTRAWAARTAQVVQHATNARPAGIGKASRVVGHSEILPEAVPRNAPCPCGSGLKHKRCCGK